MALSGVQVFERPKINLYFALAGFVILTGLKNHKSCPTAVYNNSRLYSAVALKTSIFVVIDVQKKIRAKKPGFWQKPGFFTPNDYLNIYRKCAFSNRAKYRCNIITLLWEI